MLLVVVAAACCLGGSQARVLHQEDVNPFVAGSALPPAAAAAPPPAPEAPAAAPAPPAAAPTAESPAAGRPQWLYGLCASSVSAQQPWLSTQPGRKTPCAHCPGAAGVDASTDPCACTQTGVSGGKNTSRISCGQWDVVSGSNRFTCFVNVRVWRCQK